LQVGMHLPHALLLLLLLLPLLCAAYQNYLFL
jgi:hypothetical protein